MITAEEMQKVMAAATVDSHTLHARASTGYNPGGSWIDIDQLLKMLGAMQPDQNTAAYYSAENIWFTGGDTGPLLVRLTNAKTATAEDYLTAIIAKAGGDA